VTCADIFCTQVKAIRAEHGKKAFGSVVVDQLYGYVSVSRSRHRGVHMSFSGMRGLPALIWEGSVLDAGKPLPFQSPRVRANNLQTRASAFAESPSRSARLYSLKLLVGQNPFLRASFGFWLRESSLPMNRSRNCQKTGLRVLLFLNSWRRSWTGARQLFTP